MSISSDLAVSMMIGTEERARKRRHTSRPSSLREHHVEDDEVERLLAEARQRLAAVGRLHYLVAVALQGKRQQRLDRLLVVDEEDSRCTVRH